MPQVVSLDSVAYRLAADLYGNPLEMEPMKPRQHGYSDGGRRVDGAGPRFRPTRVLDQPSRGRSSLSPAVEEQLALEARDREFLRQLRPHISRANAEMLDGLLLEALSLEDVALREGHARQAVSQRLARLCQRFPDLAERWRRHKQGAPGQDSVNRSHLP